MTLAAGTRRATPPSTSSPRWRPREGAQTPFPAATNTNKRSGRPALWGVRPARVAPVNFPSPFPLHNPGSGHTPYGCAGRAPQGRVSPRRQAYALREGPGTRGPQRPTRLRAPPPRRGGRKARRNAGARLGPGDTLAELRRDVLPEPRPRPRGRAAAFLRREGRRDGRLLAGQGIPAKKSRYSSLSTTVPLVDREEYREVIADSLDDFVDKESRALISEMAALSSLRRARHQKARREAHRARGRAQELRERVRGAAGDPRHRGPGQPRRRRQEGPRPARPRLGRLGPASPLALPEPASGEGGTTGLAAVFRVPATAADIQTRRCPPVPAQSPDSAPAHPVQHLFSPTGRDLVPVTLLSHGGGRHISPCCARHSGVG